MATIFCDTDCELWYTYARDLDLKVFRMPYIIDGEELYADLGEEFDAAEFFDRMRKGAVCKTAGLNSETYYEYMKPAFEKGEDILYIAFSSKMSQTFNYQDLTLNKLKAEYPQVRFRRYDTLSICLGAGMLVLLGAKYCREHGDDIDATCEYLDSIKDRVGIRFVVEDLKYLARGGRMSPAKAKFGNLMQIKPVLTIKDGLVDVDVKQPGLKKAYNYIIDKFKQEYEPLDGMPINVIDADNKEAADMLEARIREIVPDANIWRQPVGPVIGVHAGPGTVGIIYPKKAN